MSQITVTNKPNTGSASCPCGGWLKHWQRHYPQYGAKCAGCGGTAEHGGHVVYNGTTYIVPLCAQCNNPNNTKPYQIDSGWLAPLRCK